MGVLGSNDGCWAAMMAGQQLCYVMGTSPQ